MEVDEEEPLLVSSRRTGGLRTLPSIIVNESLERLASSGLSSNMTRYLTGDYGMSATAASYVLSLWSAASNFTPVIAAFLADSYVGRYPMIGFGSIICFFGMLVLWLTAAVPGARNFVVLYTSLALMSIGAGGVRSSSMAFGADQLRKGGRSLESYVAWYFVSVTASVLVGMSVVVYIQDNMGWTVGFGIPVVLMFLSAVSFYLSSPFYVKEKPSPSLIAGLLQVAVASYKKRGLRFSSMEFDNNNVMYHNPPGSTHLIPTHRLRFLNRACIIRNPGTEVSVEGKASDPWSLCSVEQVEGVKALIRIIPIWSSGIILAVATTPNAFQYLQVASMDRHITSNFQVPAGSFATFTMIFITIWVPLYDRLLIPLASKIAGKPVRLNVKLKMGVGIVFMCLSSAVAGVVESRRRALAIEQGFSDDPQAVVTMSAFWTLFAQMLGGLAEAFNVIGQNEFYLSELPTAMSSIATTLGGLNMFIGNLVASFILKSVDDLTKGGGKESWVSTNLNKGHFDYYNWLLCILNILNLIYFLVCSKGYGPCKGEDDYKDDVSCGHEFN